MEILILIFIRFLSKFDELNYIVLEIEFVDIQCIEEQVNMFSFEIFSHE